MTPKKQCPLLERHDEHEWYENNVFRRQCPGRKRKVTSNG